MANFLYNPDRKPKNELIAGFVVRTEIYEEIMSDLETSSMKYPEQHYLLVGQRGAGKTTLLNRIKYGVEDSAKLNKWLIPVLFSEEQYNVSELANLWENVGQYLEDYQGFDGLYNEMESHVTKNNFEEKCLDLLEKYLTARKKKLLLLIDNIGDLLNKMDENEVRRLREVLQTKSFIRLVAGSPFYLESILDYQQPFFEFFKVMRLDGLNKEETKNLLLTLGEVYGEKEKIERIVKETPQRIEAMRVITGGVPRTMALLFQIFIDNEHSNSIKDLEKILDAVTPLYKHRMDDLPKQQQKIVDAVARKWDAISVKELKDKVRLESKIISAQLRQLEKNQIIEKKTTNTKNHVYLLKERFWNIWFLMRYGRKDDKERVIWLVRFLESWCDSDDITKRIEALISKTKEGKISDEEINLFSSVYASLSQLTLDQKLMLKEADSEYISEKVKLSDEELFEAAKEMSKKKDYQKSIGYLCEIKLLNQQHQKLLVNILTEKDSVEFEKQTLYFLKEKGNSLSAARISTFILLLRISFFIQKDTKNRHEEIVNIFIELLKQLLIVQKIVNYQLNYSLELDVLVICFKNLISKGLFNISKKIIQNAKIEVVGEEVNFKDVFKPLYYAVEYFDKPEEIQNLPSEIAATTMEIRKRLSFTSP